MRIGMIAVLVGAVLLSFAQNRPMLYTARVMYGLGDSTLSGSVPAYLAETSPAHIRGAVMGSLGA
jgi:MFS family permease